MNRTYSIDEAAAMLSISRDAVRKRISRGPLEAKKDKSGRWRVIIPDERPDTDRTTSGQASRQMQEEIDFLRKELERKDHILMALTQKIPQLEAPKDPDNNHDDGHKKKGFLRHMMEYFKE